MHDHLRQQNIRCYNEREAPGALAELAFKSRAKLAVLPMQDLHALDTEARMNFPGKLGNNWAWRYEPEYLDPILGEELLGLAKRTGRV
jgi:4-alpha-glucanotransferase